MILVILAFLVLLIVSLKKPLYVSPLSTQGVQALRSPEDNDPEILENLLKEKNIQYSKVALGPDSTYIITLTDGEQALVSFQKDIRVEISSLQFILSRLTMEGKQFRSVDLRFDKPVIIQQ